MIQALLFDLDGLLIDSEPLHFACWRETLATVGYALDEETYRDHWTRAGLGAVDFLRLHALPHDAALLRVRKNTLYEQRVRTDLRLMPGARQCLEHLRGHKRLALATAGFPEATHPALAAHDLRPYFEAVVTRADVRRFKPDPDVFLRAAELLGVQPGHCLVVEDAEKGVLAAHAAGMRCVVVPSQHTFDNDFSHATMVLPSLHDLTLARIEQLP